MPRKILMLKRREERENNTPAQPAGLMGHSRLFISQYSLVLSRSCNMSCTLLAQCFPLKGLVGGRSSRASNHTVTCCKAAGNAQRQVKQCFCLPQTNFSRCIPWCILHQALPPVRCCSRCPSCLDCPGQGSHSFHIAACFRSPISTVKVSYNLSAESLCI